MRRIDRERRQQRENMGKEIFLEPNLFRLGHVGAIHQHDAGIGERRAQLAPLRLLILDQNRHGLGNADQLLGGGQALRTSGVDAFSHLRAEAGDAHHKKFVEIVGGDRQELQSLKQRVLAVGQFFKDAAVEVQPRQFAVNETIRTGGEIRTAGPRRLFRRALFQTPNRTGFPRNGSGLAPIGHGALVLLKSYICHFITIR